MEFNVLVFPCGSEIALELHNAMQYSIHVNLFGANSIDDHGKFIYENYIGDLPFFDDPKFIDRLNEIIEKYNIDCIFPAMDSVIAKVSENSTKIKCKIIGSSDKVNQICLSKLKTYKLLKNVVPCPKLYDLKQVTSADFPLFLKPEVGYGSKGIKLVHNYGEIEEHLKEFPNCLISEYLPGEEITVDCFTDRFGKLRYSNPRIRRRISNGISVNTESYLSDNLEVENFIEKINQKIKFRGAWFAQLKKNKSGDFVLMEIASRFAGSSALSRAKGVNLPLLSLFDAFDFDVKIDINNYSVELDRALENKFKTNISYTTVFCDFDDCLIIRDKVNYNLISFLFKALNERKKLVLITKHNKDIHQTLKNYRLNGLFDEIIHIKPDDYKFKYIHADSIFIDDSFAERNHVYLKIGIPVFSPDMIEVLL